MTLIELYHTLCLHGTMSQAELLRLSRLSPPALAALLGQLERMGKIEQLAADCVTGGCQRCDISAGCAPRYYRAHSASKT